MSVFVYRKGASQNGPLDYDAEATTSLNLSEGGEGVDFDFTLPVPGGSSRVLVRVREESIGRLRVMCEQHKERKQNKPLDEYDLDELFEEIKRRSA